ncbi:MAG: DUF262 domain-containing HNH endonuclease family protein [Bacilli bacterium]|nr:DUF262 domain-containing HNH endonuclease family protein [Bacilli bacterium]
MKNLESLKSIFKERIFKIPDYQRGYAWQKEQLKDFWEDITNLPNNRFHYTGLLSLKEVPPSVYNDSNWISDRWLINDHGYKPFHVVDGQQRLTTFVIFINEIVNFIKNLDINKGKNLEDIYIGTLSLKKIIEEYILMKMPPNYNINTYKFGYEVDNPSFEYLKHKILGEPDGGVIEETFYTLNLENARSFFKENIENYFDKYGLTEIENLFRKITQNLMFNLHEIEDDFDVFVAFETMNNRGKKLSNLELLKNRLIYLTTLYEENELSKDGQLAIRKEINKAWKDIYFNLGKNKKNPLSDDDFLIAHWIMYFQYSRGKGDDYIKFLLKDKFNPQNIFTKTEIKTETIEEIIEIRDVDSDEEEAYDNDYSTKTELISKLSSSEILEYVKSIKTASVHWYNSFNPINNNELSEQEQIWIDRLNRIGIAYFRPLVCASFMGENISSEERIELFKNIERFIFIAFRIGRATSNYRNAAVYRVTKQLRAGEISIKEVIKQLNDRIDNWLTPNTGIDIQSFVAYIERKFKNNEGFYQWNGISYFLYEYESKFVEEKGNPKIDWKLFVKGEKDKVSIEHILPQDSTNEYWQQRFGEFDNNQMKYLNGTLGNLLPLSQSINSSLQNIGFNEKVRPSDDKRRGYAEGSHSEIEVSTYSEWTKKEIIERGIKLLNFMEIRWGFMFKSEDSKLDFLGLKKFIKNEEVEN